MFGVTVEFAWCRLFYLYGEGENIQRLVPYLRAKLANAAVSRIELVRPGGNLNVTIYTGRPGIVIGKKVKILKNSGLPLPV